MDVMIFPEINLYDKLTYKNTQILDILEKDKDPMTIGFFFLIRIRSIMPTLMPLGFQKETNQCLLA